MTSDPDLPPPPEKPAPDECCGCGCVPCILELYEEALERWREEVERIEQQRRAASSAGGVPNKS